MHFIHESATPRVVFGRGSVAQVSTEVDRIGGERVLLIGNPRRAGLRRMLAGRLEPRVVGIVDRVQEHVPQKVAEEAALQAVSLNADLLLPVGGGSAIGAAKAVARRTGLPILAVPTTYSGSEMTPIWGETKDQMKVTGRDSTVAPRTVLYDPDLTESMPDDLRATSGLNALAHCAEAMYDPTCSPLVRAAAVQGARFLVRGLRRRLDSPDANGGEDILCGAWLAGVALAGASMGLHHKLCHIIGGQQRLPHGAMHAVLLPYVLSYEEPAARDVLDGFAEAVGPGSAAQAVWDLGRYLGTPASLSAIGFQRSGIQDVVDAVLAGPPTGPRSIDPSELRDLLESANRGLPPHDSTRN